MLKQCFIKEKNNILNLIKICNNNYLSTKTFINDITEFNLENLGFLYVLNRIENEKISENNDIIFSPIKLNSITTSDFLEDNYFMQYDTKIGYDTFINNGIWVLYKKDQIRYNIKKGFKKLAVIQLKQTNAGEVSCNYFSYNTKIENSIKKLLNSSESVINLITNINFGNDIYEIENDLNNTSLNVLIKRINFIFSNINIEYFEDNLNSNSLQIKCNEILKRYASISTNLKLERENMKFNFEYQKNTTEKKELIILNQKSTVYSEIKSFIKSIIKLYKINVSGMQNNFINLNGGKDE